MVAQTAERKQTKQQSREHLRVLPPTGTGAAAEGRETMLRAVGRVLIGQRQLLAWREVYKAFAATDPAFAYKGRPYQAQDEYRWLWNEHWFGPRFAAEVSPPVRVADVSSRDDAKRAEARLEELAGEHADEASQLLIKLSDFESSRTTEQAEALFKRIGTSLIEAGQPEVWRRIFEHECSASLDPLPLGPEDLGDALSYLGLHQPAAPAERSAGPVRGQELMSAGQRFDALLEQLEELVNGGRAKSLVIEVSNTKGALLADHEDRLVRDAGRAILAHGGAAARTTWQKVFAYMAAKYGFGPDTVAQPGDEIIWLHGDIYHHPELVEHLPAEVQPRARRLLAGDRLAGTIVLGFTPLPAGALVPFHTLADVAVVASERAWHEEGWGAKVSDIEDELSELLSAVRETSTVSQQQIDSIARLKVGLPVLVTQGTEFGARLGFALALTAPERCTGWRGWVGAAHAHLGRSGCTTDEHQWWLDWFSRDVRAQMRAARCGAEYRPVPHPYSSDGR